MPCSHSDTIHTPALASVVLLAALLTNSAAAVQLTDGSLDVNIDNDGTFDDIFLNGQEIDGSSFVQEYTGAICTRFSGGSVVSVAGNTASYSATCGSFDVSVTSELLGALGSNPGTTAVMRDTLVFTNNTAGPLPLESVSYMDQDLASSSNDVVRFDATSQAVVATDSVDASPNTLFWAAIASTDCSDSTFGYDVDNLGDQSVSFPMDNGNGPVGPADTAMTIGYDCGTIAAGASATITYQYLFSTNLSDVPADFGLGQASAAARSIPVLPLGGLLGVIALVLYFGSHAVRRRVA